MPHASRQLGLSASEVRDYFEVGWITRRALFRTDEIARMRACFDDLEQIAKQLTTTGMHRGTYFVLGGTNGVHVIQRVVWAGGCQPYLLEVGSDPRLTVPCAQLLRSDAMDHLLNQAHFKRPRDGVAFDWHQDIRHRDKGTGTWVDVNGCGSFVQTVIVLDEMKPDSGPLLFLPGSSKWGRVDFGDHDRHGLDLRANRLAHITKEDAITIAAQPGDALFFGPYTVHASFENTSDRYRRILINGYASPGANRRPYPGDGAGRTLWAPAELARKAAPPGEEYGGNRGAAGRGPPAKPIRAPWPSDMRCEADLVGAESARANLLVCGRDGRRASHRPSAAAPVSACACSSNRPGGSSS